MNRTINEMFKIPRPDVRRVRLARIRSIEAFVDDPGSMVTGSLTVASQVIGKYPEEIVVSLHESRNVRFETRCALVIQRFLDDDAIRPSPVLSTPSSGDRERERERERMCVRRRTKQNEPRSER